MRCMCYSNYHQTFHMLSEISTPLRLNGTIVTSLFQWNNSESYVAFLRKGIKNEIPCTQLLSFPYSGNKRTWRVLHGAALSAWVLSDYMEQNSLQFFPLNVLDVSISKKQLIYTDSGIICYHSIINYILTNSLEGSGNDFLSHQQGGKNEAKQKVTSVNNMMQ